VIPLREIRAARRDNAVYALLAKRLRSPSQVAMLVVATAVAAGACWAIYPFVPPGADGLLIWFCIRWGVGELLWTWMAADHSFSEYRRAHDSGQLRDWALTRHSMPEIAQGFVYSGFASLGIAIIAWSIVNVIVVPLLLDAERGVVLLLALAAGETIIVGSHMQTALLSTWRCLAESARYGVSVVRWAWTMIRLGGLLACLGIFALLCVLGIRGGYAEWARSSGRDGALAAMAIGCGVAALSMLLLAKHALVQNARRAAETGFAGIVDRPE